MDMMELRHFEELLKKEKKKWEDSLKDEDLGVGANIKEMTGELSSYDNHPGDMANTTFEAEKNFSFRTSDKFLYSEVQTALKKIAEGTYGICEICHREIDTDRLEIRPYSRLCIHCENDMEQKVNDEERGRPIEEQVLFPPFGRSFTDNSVEDKVEFDGEDTWDAVNEYNPQTYDNQYGIDDEAIGYVEDVDQISNEQYKRQLE